MCIHTAQGTCEMAARSSRVAMVVLNEGVAAALTVGGVNAAARVVIVAKG